jgi:FeS assembly SUF system regulator
MIKISRMADYAVVVLSAFTDVEQGQDRLLSAASVSEITRLPEPTVSKILKLLTRGDVLKSVRGANGGYTLSKSAHDITIADIINAIEGPIALTACVEGASSNCDYAQGCPIHGRWDDVNDAISNALANVSLHDMVAPKNNVTALKEGTQ